LTTTSPRVAYGLPLKRSQRVGPADLAFLEAGPPDGPTALLLHGFPTHAFLWRHVVRALEDGGIAGRGLDVPKLVEIDEYDPRQQAKRSDWTYGGAAWPGT